MHENRIISMVQKNSFTIFNQIKKTFRLSCVQSRDALMNGGTESLNKVQLELVDLNQGKVWRQEEAAYNPKQTTL